MHRRNGRCGKELEHEIAVGHCIERIAHRPIEAQLFRGHGAVDREGGAGKGCRPQRRFIHALPHIRNAAPVPRQHLDISEKMMAEGDGLGHLQMGEARHDGRCMFFGLHRQCQLQVAQLAVEMVADIADIEAEIGRHLVVARTRGVETPGCGADQVLEPLLDIHMDVFQRARKSEGAAVDFGLNLLEAALYVSRVGLRDDALFGEHPGMGE